MKFSTADIILIPFPFTDQSGTKKRPTLIVSSETYNQSRDDLIVMPITSQISSSMAIWEVPIDAWHEAGLLKPSSVKPVLTTIEKTLIIRQLGHLQDEDFKSVQSLLQRLLAQG